jgi:hypothetical protein
MIARYNWRRSIPRGHGRVKNTTSAADMLPMRNRSWAAIDQPDGKYIIGDGVPSPVSTRILQRIIPDSIRCLRSVFTEDQIQVHERPLARQSWRFYNLSYFSLHFYHLPFYVSLTGGGHVANNR